MTGRVATMIHRLHDDAARERKATAAEDGAAVAAKVLEMRPLAERIWADLEAGPTGPEPEDVASLVEKFRELDALLAAPAACLVLETESS